MLELNLYKNTNTDSKYYGKYYPRVELKKSMSLDDLAEHMSQHNTPFSKGTIHGILTDMVDCIRELTLEGNVIKIPNLALFKCSVEGAPIDKLDAAVAGLTGNGGCVRAVKLLAQSKCEFTRGELSKDARFKWTSLAQDAIDKAKAPAAGEGGGEG